MRRLIGLLLLLLGACASPSQPRLQLPEPQLSPQAMGQTLSLSQRLTVLRVPEGSATTRERSLEAILEMDSESLRLAGFALGQRVLSLHWDGKQLASERHPLLPAEVDARHILRDVQWVYGPLAALQASLPEGWAIVDRGRERVLSFQGDAVLLIHYAADLRSAGGAELDNRLEAYRLLIESSPQ